MTSPWRPEGLPTLGPLGLGFSVPGGVLQESAVAWRPTHRVIMSEHAGENIFDQIADEEDLEAIRIIADVTNPHIRAQLGEIDLVAPEDRIFAAGSGLIMAAFAFPGRPSRFSDGSRGTFYGARAEETAVRETVHHWAEFLSGSGPTVIEVTLLNASLDATLVDIRSGQPCPAGVYHDRDYTAGQQLGQVVRDLRGYGIVYSSVRHSGGECVAIFRPPVLSECQAVRELHYHWDGAEITAR